MTEALERFISHIVAAMGSVCDRTEFLCLLNTLWTWLTFSNSYTPAVISRPILQSALSDCSEHRCFAISQFIKCFSHFLSICISIPTYKITKSIAVYIFFNTSFEFVNREPCNNWYFCSSNTLLQKNQAYSYTTVQMKKSSRNCLLSKYFIKQFISDSLNYSVVFAS